MEPLSNLWTVIILVGALQGFILSLFLLVNKKGNRSANKILAFFIVSISVDVFVSYLYLSDTVTRLPHFVAVSEPLYTTFGPLLYLYTRFLTDLKFKFRKRHALYFAPAFIEMLLWMPFYLKPASVKLFEYQVALKDEQTLISYWFFWLFELIYNLVFFFLSVKVLKVFQDRIKNMFSDIHQINFNWLKKFILITGVFFCVHILILIISFFNESLVNELFILLYVFLAVSFYGIGYTGLRQPEIFSGIQPFNGSNLQKENSVKYEKSSLTEVMKEKHLGNLLEFMEKEKPYLADNLKLSDIAGKLSISPNHLSQVINQKLDRNFFDFVNSYRVQEAQSILREPRSGQITLLAVAFEAGFRSKSSFNKIFKEKLGMTPSQYHSRHFGGLS